MDTRKRPPERRISHQLVADSEFSPRHAEASGSKKPAGEPFTKPKQTLEQRSPKKEETLKKFTLDQPQTNRIKKPKPSPKKP